MSCNAFFIASPEGKHGRNLISASITAAFATRYSVATFRPIVCPRDKFTYNLINLGNIEQDFYDSRVMCGNRASADHELARADIARTWENFISQYNADITVITGSDGRPTFDPEGFILDTQIAADLKAPVILAICCSTRNAKEVRNTVNLCIRQVNKTGNSVAAVFITGLDTTDPHASDKKTEIEESLADISYPHWIIPAHECMSSEDIEPAVKIFKNSVSDEEILALADKDFSTPTTPYAFQAHLLTQAMHDKKTIVLPEGEEDRIITAADYLLERDIVNLIIVGNQTEIMQRAEQLNLHSLNKARFQSLTDESVLEPMIEKLVELRSSKGMTPEKARQTLMDPSYFGTMLVVLGQADGLVSGSVNSTANTVRPALQVIKTQPGQSLVSGAFLMCFEDHVSVFADCAINLNPQPEQLAHIAIQSAQTARSFGLEPRVGMLSYSTLGSGTGPDVDLVTEATEKVRQLEPQLPVVGPIQFDAAWSSDVARTKAPGNDVAGHVNVFVFPNLSVGNIAYKAVQRSSGALAIGPVLQGLNKPVNDLSRGAKVEDIINTIALTAIYAQNNK